MAEVELKGESPERAQAGKALVNRVSAETALVRNRFVLANCSRAVFAAIDPQGALAKLLDEFTELRVECISGGE